MNTLALFQGISHWELIIVLVIGLLLFGKRLPEVGRSLGKGIVEFKRGLKGIEDDIEHQSSEPASLEAPSGRPPLTSEGEDVRVSQSQHAETRSTESGA